MPDMQIHALDSRPNIQAKSKTFKSFETFSEILVELRKRDLPQTVVNSINSEIDKLNASFQSDKELQKQLHKSQRTLLTLLEKEEGLVTNNHYRRLWLVLGMSVFGIPLGVAFGFAMGNMGLLGIGLPIGMAIGIVVGSQKDKKAQAEGKQLNVEIK